MSTGNTLGSVKKPKSVHFGAGTLYIEGQGCVHLGSPVYTLVPPLESNKYDKIRRGGGSREAETPPPSLGAGGEKGVEGKGKGERGRRRGGKLETGPSEEIGGEGL